MVVTQLNRYGMEIVIYDEVEMFRAYNNPQFAYPYELRKNNLVEFNFALEVPVSED